MIGSHVTMADTDFETGMIRYLKDEIGSTDLGCEGRDAVDYPVYARKVTDAIKSGTCEKEILICGTGIGISIAANKVPGIRAALCTDCFYAEATRQPNNANVLALGGRVVGPTWQWKLQIRSPPHGIFGAERHQEKPFLIEGDKA